jgi:cellulose biosynthesis protein BcsQ
MHELTGNLKGDLAKLQTTLLGHQEELKVERRRIDKVLQKDGETWTERVRVNVPDFEPFQPGNRRTPILSVLNLKGGVGKTTITANLGAALSGLGYRVLLLDLDLQGSLTSLFLPESEQNRLDESRLLIGNFLAASFESAYPKLTDDYIQPTLANGESGLVATTDKLAYAEMNLTIRWLLREGKDPRFLLRRELHLKRITNRYDIVLLDCPPLINVCCVNALAASDYVLIPILPSKQATDRAPILLKRLKEVRDGTINTNLKVLGIVANRTQRSELTLDEQNRLTALRATCKDIWGQEVPLFDTFIRQNAELRAAEDEHRPVHPDGVMYSTFVELAQEVKNRLPIFCHPKSKTTVPAKETVS